MKLLWFHLMPYTELPDDFARQHPSVWVDIHSSLFDPKRAHLMYNDFMDEMEFAADCGFDAVCCNEHHSNGYGLMPSPNLIASALARRTTHTAICVMGNSLALYNPPTRVAEEFAMIDCISGGRLIAGFPVGTPMDTCYAFGQNPSLLRERYLEAHDLVMRAWTEQDTFAFNGRFNQQRYVNIWPRPVQQPHPPIWIPGGGSIETWQWCARMDYVYAYLSYFGYKDGRATMDGFWTEMARLGKDRNPYRAGFLQFVGVAETREKALELYREAGNSEGAAAALDSLGYIYNRLGEHEEAIACFYESLDLLAGHGNRYKAAEALEHLAEAYSAIGDLPDARAALEQALSILEAMRHPAAATVRDKLADLQ